MVGWRLSPARALLLCVLFPLALGLAACGGNSNTRPVAEDEYQDYRYKGGEQGRLFGDSGLVLGVGGKNGQNQNREEGAALGVNAYLWRGALDTLSFMPLASADPFGGVIITDWYEPPSAPGERFKATAYILGRQLRADGVKVNIFRQVLENGRWVDAPVSRVTTGEIENKVLARARELRVQTASR
ncbi:MAG: DUF3576 domain-containing protein [Acetobacteraceae bacterium]|nr:DUF3576 domain-containing protein [Acetobacteraceae bacterium]